MTEPARLSKYLASQIGCSRREAELYIESGWVQVDGVVEQSPRVIITDQQVKLHPDAVLVAHDPVSLLLNQPADQPVPLVLDAAHYCSNNPYSKTPLPAHLVRHNNPMPLPTGASGLLILTQDRRFERSMKEDAYKLEQEYIVEVSGDSQAANLQLLQSRLIYRGKAIPDCKVSWQNEIRLRFALKQPQDGQLAWMCEQVGLSVVSQRRIRIGAISMAKLPVEHWRYLSSKERF
jgi:23S rRNA pseudouridine2604 synthase